MLALALTLLVNSAEAVRHSKRQYYPVTVLEAATLADSGAEAVSDSSSFAAEASSLLQLHASASTAGSSDPGLLTDLFDFGKSAVSTVEDGASAVRDLMQGNTTAAKSDFNAADASLVKATSAGLGVLQDAGPIAQLIPAEGLIAKGMGAINKAAKAEQQGGVAGLVGDLAGAQAGQAVKAVEGVASTVQGVLSGSSDANSASLSRLERQVMTMHSAITQQQQIESHAKRLSKLARLIRTHSAVIADATSSSSPITSTAAPSVAAPTVASNAATIASLTQQLKLNLAGLGKWTKRTGSSTAVAKTRVKKTPGK